LFLPTVYFLATPMSFDATGKKNVNFTYGGKTFQANTEIQSKLKLDHYDLALYYTMLDKLSGGVFNLDLGLNVRAISFEGTVTQDSTGLSASKDLSLYVPMVYAGVQVKPVSAFSIEAEGRGIKFGNNSYYDLMGRVRVNPASFLFISAGYRQETIKLDTNDVKTDIKFAGPFAEVGLSF
jgi:outer membrane protein